MHAARTPDPPVPGDYPRDVIVADSYCENTTYRDTARGFVRFSEQPPNGEAPYPKTYTFHRPDSDWV